MSNPHPRNVPEWLPRAQAMNEKNLSTREIARELRIGRSTVWRWLTAPEDGKPRGEVDNLQRRARRRPEERVSSAEPAPKASAGMLAAGRFYNPADKRAGR